MDVLDLDAHVVDAAILVLVQVVFDGALVAERVQQLQLGVAQVDKHCRDAVLGQRLGRAALAAKDVAVQRDRLLQVGHGDGDVVEVAQLPHGLGLCTEC